MEERDNPTSTITSDSRSSLSGVPSPSTRSHTSRAALARLSATPGSLDRASLATSIRNRWISPAAHTRSWMSSPKVRIAGSAPKLSSMSVAMRTAPIARTGTTIQRGPHSGMAMRRRRRRRYAFNHRYGERRMIAVQTDDPWEDWKAGTFAVTPTSRQQAGRPPPTPELPRIYNAGLRPSALSPHADDRFPPLETISIESECQGNGYFLCDCSSTQVGARVTTPKFVQVLESLAKARKPVSQLPPVTPPRASGFCQTSLDVCGRKCGQ